MSRRKSRGKGKKRLAYWVIAAVFILLCFLAYSFLQQSNETPNNDVTPSQAPQAAIVDHLSFTGQSNQTFVNACEAILYESGLTWTYYRGENVTVDFYRNLPSYGTSLIILRAHSAIMKTEEGTVSILGFFTSERYYGPDDAYAKYPTDVEDDRLVRAFFPWRGGEEYFGIVPRFIEKSMKGEFEDAIVIMMGCEGIGYIDTRTDARAIYTDMAEAFVKKGAKVYISWDGPIGVDYTDQATIQLLQSLVQEKQTLGNALEDISPDPIYKSRLRFYPEEAGDYRILGMSSDLTSSVFGTNTICIKPWRSQASNRPKLRRFYYIPIRLLGC